MTSGMSSLTQSSVLPRDSEYAAGWYRPARGQARSRQHLSTVRERRPRFLLVIAAILAYLAPIGWLAWTAWNGAQTRDQVFVVLAIGIGLAAGWAATAVEHEFRLRSRFRF
jgi:hypothetical protein